MGDYIFTHYFGRLIRMFLNHFFRIFKGEKMSYQGDLDQYKKKLRVDPRDHDTRFNLGFTYLAKGDMTKAFVELETALKQKVFKESKSEPEKVPRGFHILFFPKSMVSEGLTGAVQKAEIIPLYEANSQNHQEKERDPNSLFGKTSLPSKEQERVLYYLHLSLSQMYLQMGKINLAIEEGNIALRLKSKDSSLYIYLGSLYKITGEYFKAIELCKKALQLDKNNFVPAYNISCYYALLKKFDKAIAWLRKACRRGFADFSYAEKDPDLVKLVSQEDYLKLKQDLIK